MKSYLKVNDSMKPKIDLQNPIIKEAMSIYQTNVINALNAEQTVEKAVVPIYHISDKKFKLEQIASGVIINIKDEYFILSASHVFDQIGNYAICIGVEPGKEVIQLPGERFSSPKGASGTHNDDVIDASAYHITGDVPESIKKLSITMDVFDTEKSENNINIVYLASGFRVKKSNTKGNAIYSKKEAFPSCEITDKNYEILNLDSNMYVILNFEEQMLVEGKWQLSPTPKGFSGGAIIKVIPAETETGVVYKQKLTGIIIEHRKKNKQKNIDGVLIGTRINVHLAAIEKYLPELFAE